MSLLPDYTPTEQVAAEVVKVWPLMLISAKRNNLGGAARVYFLVQHLDGDGKGWVAADDLSAKAFSLRIKEKTFKRWLEQALEKKLLIAGRGNKLSFVSWARAAEILGCTKSDKYYSEIRLSALVSKGWFAFVWAAFLSTLGEKPRSRRVLEEMTGIPKRTQRHLEQEAGITNTPNYAQSGLSNDVLSGANEFQDLDLYGVKHHAFPGKDGPMWRMPNTYHTEGIADRGLKGRSRKIKTQLNHLSRVGQVKKIVKVFHDTAQQAETAIRRLARENIAFWEVSELYTKEHEGKNADIWAVVPTFS